MQYFYSFVCHIKILFIMNLDYACNKLIYSIWSYQTKKGIYFHFHVGEFINNRWCIKIDYNEINLCIQLTSNDIYAHTFTFHTILNALIICGICLLCTSYLPLLSLNYYNDSPYRWIHLSTTVRSVSLVIYVCRLGH